jgi:hypothetical protein
MRQPRKIGDGLWAFIPDDLQQGRDSQVSKAEAELPQTQSWASPRLPEQASPAQRPSFLP